MPKNHDARPKAHRPPPIQYLAAFESAARHCSFKTAGEELNISASAISQQIKALENFLGLSLFERKPREVKLSGAGYSFYQVAEQTLNQYKTGFSQFSERYHSSTLRISTESYVAHEIIIPRMQDFSERHPYIDLVIETSMKVEDLANSDLDAAIRFGLPPWPNYQAELLCKAQSNLVASKAYLEEHPLKQAEDFEHQTLLHTRSDINDWQRVINLFSVTEPPAKEFFFDSYSAALRAAESGLGLAIGLTPSINKPLREGKLVAVSKQHMPLQEAFYFVSKPNESKAASYYALHQWLIEIFSQH